MRQKIIRYIEREQLKAHDRTRYMTYRRFVIAKILRDEGETLMEIGSLLDRNHASVINMLKSYATMSVYKDFQHLENQIREQLEIKTLSERVLECKDFWQMEKLKEQIKNKEI